MQQAVKIGKISTTDGSKLAKGLGLCAAKRKGIWVHEDAKTKICVFPRKDARKLDNRGQLFEDDWRD